MTDNARVSEILTEVAFTETHFGYTPSDSIALSVSSSAQEDERSHHVKRVGCLALPLEPEFLNDAHKWGPLLVDAINEMRRQLDEDENSDGVRPGVAHLILWGDALTPTADVAKVLRPWLGQVGVLLWSVTLVTDLAVYCATPGCSKVGCLPPEGVPRGELDLMFPEGPPGRLDEPPKPASEEDRRIAAEALAEASQMTSEELMMTTVLGWFAEPEMTPQWAGAACAGLRMSSVSTFISFLMNDPDPNARISEMLNKTIHGEPLREIVKQVFEGPLHMDRTLHRTLEMLRYTSSVLPEEPMPHLLTAHLLLRLGNHPQAVRVLDRVDPKTVGGSAKTFYEILAHTIHPQDEEKS